jgi:hypothetical protein
MKIKIFLFIILGLFLNSCGTGLTNTTSSNMKAGAAKIGMTKKEFCLEFNTLRLSQDPCKGPIFKSPYKTLGLYFPETKMEIAHDAKLKYFFVFENVTTPIDRFNVLDGDGTLIKIFNNFEEAKDFAAGAKYSIGTDKVKKAKEACKNLGFNPGSEEFAKCSLKKLKEQSE